MKTTIDIPDALYMKAKIRAAESGRTLKAIVLGSLEREFEDPALASTPPVSYWANRKMRPDFKKQWDSGALSGGTDSTQIISENRDAR